MNMLQRLLQTNSISNRAEEEDAPRPLPMGHSVNADWIDLNVPAWAHRWKRLIIMLNIAMYHALTGSIIFYLEEFRQRRAEEALQEYLRLAMQFPRPGLRAEHGQQPTQQIYLEKKGKCWKGAKPVAGNPGSRSRSIAYIHRTNKLHAPEVPTNGTRA